MAVDASEGDSGLRSAKRSSRCEGMLKKSKIGWRGTEADMNFLLHFSTYYEKTVRYSLPIKIVSRAGKRKCDVMIEAG